VPRDAKWVSHMEYRGQVVVINKWANWEAW